MNVAPVSDLSELIHLCSTSPDLVTDCLKMCNMYLPLHLFLFKSMGPEDNEMRVFSCLAQAVFSGSKSKLKKITLLRIVFCFFKHKVVFSSLPMSLVNLQF